MYILSEISDYRALLSDNVGENSMCRSEAGFLDEISSNGCWCKIIVNSFHNISNEHDYNFKFFYLIQNLYGPMFSYSNCRM